MSAGSRRRASRIACVLVTAVPLVCSASASAETINVAPAGSDQATGSAAAPLRTIPAALARAQAGDVVLLAPGTYPLLRDTQARSGTVTIRGAAADRTATALQGAQLYGTSRLTIEHLAVRGRIDVSAHPTRATAQGAQDVVLQDLDVSSTEPESCIKIRNTALRITVRGNHLHDCWGGIGAPGNVPISRGISILDNRIERMTADGITFGNWHDVTIAGNVITDVVDPADQIHNDNIQVVGEVRGLTIERNVLLRSDDQVMILQDVTGPVDDVLVRDNVIAGAGAVAVQTAGLTNTRWIHNTIARSRWSGLWVRGGIRRDASGATTVPTDTVIANNVLSGLAYKEGARAGTARGNVVSDCANSKVSAEDRCVGDLGLQDPSTFDLRLSASSLARGFAVSTFALPELCSAGAVVDAGARLVGACPVAPPPASDGSGTGGTGGSGTDVAGGGTAGGGSAGGSVGGTTGSGATGGGSVYVNANGPAGGGIGDGPGPVASAAPATTTAAGTAAATAAGAKVVRVVVTASASARATVRATVTRPVRATASASARATARSTAAATVPAGPGAAEAARTQARSAARAAARVKAVRQARRTAGARARAAARAKARARAAR